MLHLKQEDNDWTCAKMVHTETYKAGQVMRFTCTLEQRWCYNTNYLAVRSELGVQ